MADRIDPDRRLGLDGADLPLPAPDGNPSIAGLVRRLADDGRLLVQQEIALAKVELQSNVATLARRSVLIGLGIALMLVGLLVLLAFLVLALAALLGGRYWLSSLIVGSALAAAGMTAVLVGRSGLARQRVKPERTVESLRESADWARAEAQQLKNELTRSNGSA